MKDRYPVAGDSVFLCKHVRDEARAGRSFHVLETLPDQAMLPGDAEYGFLLLCERCMGDRDVDPTCPIEGDTVVWDLPGDARLS